MSHTEVYDPRATERALVNEVNRAVRRCRVGKIVWKRSVYQPFSPVSIPSWPMPARGKPLHDFTDPCAGCLGKACGNVACPKRTVVTC